MSILKSTHSGSQYAKWLEDLNAYAKRSLYIGKIMYKTNPKESMWKIVNCNVITDRDVNGKLKIAIKKFRFLATWSVEEFKKAFIEYLEKEKPINCLISEIPIALEIKVEHEHT